MAIGVSASCVVASSSCIALSCAQLLHAMLPNHCPATCCQRRAARTGNGTRDALLNAVFGCRTNCLRDPQNTTWIRRPSTTTARGQMLRESAMLLSHRRSLCTHTAPSPQSFVMRSCHTIVPRCCSLSFARAEPSARVVARVARAIRS